MDPLVRLTELVDMFHWLPPYFYQANLNNGILCKCTVNVFVDSTVELFSETRFVETQDLEEAKRVVVAIMLNRAGLFPLDEEDDEEEHRKNIQSRFVKNFSYITSTVNELFSNPEGSDLKKLIDCLSK